MSKYIVYMPVTGFMSVEVEADNSDEAVSKALGSKVTELNTYSLTPHVEVMREGIYQGGLSKAFADLVEVEEH